ncbi:MAG TPA: hypothetical protein VFU43_18650 [Streptosporangiaceae bacterium]|nr:hypothetical protein [Streptosporangiaceae bacterium]
MTTGFAWFGLPPALCDLCGADLPDDSPEAAEFTNDAGTVVTVHAACGLFAGLRPVLPS